MQKVHPRRIIDDVIAVIRSAEGGESNQKMSENMFWRVKVGFNWQEV